jgi:serine/threonine protein kinase/Flp pilus assembly protein TadD
MSLLFGLETIILAMFETGLRVGPYEVVSTLARGGMGEVYLAVDTRLNREVAIKVMPAHLCRDEDAISRFETEAKALAAFSHPNIITIYDVGYREGVPYVVMELLKGSTLRDVLLGGPFTVARTLEVSIAIVDGLYAAHTHHVIHRDIKPENIFVTSDGQIKILDFGLAKFEETEEEENLAYVTTKSVYTKPGVLYGSLPYMSPEQVTGKVVDERTDIFSFGCLLYEMLTGVRPFYAPTSPELIASILRDDPPINKMAVPADMEAIIFRCLQKDASERFQSTSDLRLALEQVSRRFPLLQACKESNFSVAVLYFENLGSSEDDDYIRDGISEDVITELSKIRKLKVYPRSAVLPFRDKPFTAAEIAQQIRARYILEGSIRRSRDRMRITARLIDAEQGHSIWSERFDRQFEDIFRLQDDLAKNIASALRITLSKQEECDITRKPTDNPAAYFFYLRGRNYIRRRTRKDFDHAFEMFQRAITIEPAFGLAYACLAFTSAMIYVWYDSNELWYERTINFAHQAKLLDPEIPETLVAEAMILMGNKEYERAIQLSKQAIAIERQCDGAYWILGVSLFCTDRFSEIRDSIDQAIEAIGDDYNVYMPLIFASEKLGDFERSAELERKLRDVLARQLERVPDDARARMLVAGFNARFGKEEESIRDATEAVRLRPNDNRILYNAACIYARLNRKEESLMYVKKAIETGYKNKDWMMRDPDLSNLHDCSEFQQILKR